MEDLLSLKYGIGGLCVLLTIFILLKVVEFVINLKKKKEDETEDLLRELVASVNHLDKKFDELEKQISDYPKIKSDLRRCFFAVKLLAGDRWAEIRKEIMESEFEL